MLHAVTDCTSDAAAFPLSLDRREICLNPFAAPACNISGLKGARTRLKNSMFSGPVTHLLSVLCRFDENPFTYQCETERNRKEKREEKKDEEKNAGFHISHFISRFEVISDILVVKG